MLHSSNRVIFDVENEEELATEDHTVEYLMKLRAVSTIQGYVCALKDYYTSEKQAWPLDVALSLGTIIASYKRDEYLFK